MIWGELPVKGVAGGGGESAMLSLQQLLLNGGLRRSDSVTAAVNNTKNYSGRYTCILFNLITSSVRCRW